AVMDSHLKCLDKCITDGFSSFLDFNKGAVETICQFFLVGGIIDHLIANRRKFIK
ncbi:hypothetical protein FCV25MIE_16270, partial [Fagus crenata]